MANSISPGEGFGEVCKKWKEGLLTGKKAKSGRGVRAERFKVGIFLCQWRKKYDYLTTKKKATDYTDTTIHNYASL